MGEKEKAAGIEEDYPDPIPLMGNSRPRQPFLTKSQTQEQNRQRSQILGWIYLAVHGVDLPQTPAPGTLRKYAESLDWFISASITKDQICHAVSSAKRQWHNVENIKQAINPKSLADNWTALYTPPKAPTPAAPTIVFDFDEPLLGLTKKAFIDHFWRFTPVQNWEYFAEWAQKRPDMLDHALYARELILAVDKAIYGGGGDRYEVEPDPKGLEIPF
jgi:hypothetical protein